MVSKEKKSDVPPLERLRNATTSLVAREPLKLLLTTSQKRGPALSRSPICFKLISVWPQGFFFYSKAAANALICAARRIENHPLSRQHHQGSVDRKFA
jgi:hypothetical protein